MCLGVCRACPCLLLCPFLDLSIWLELFTGGKMLLITPQAFLTNTHTDSRSLLRISACAVTHTHTCTAVWRSFRCSYTGRSVYSKNKNVHHIEPTRLRMTNTDKRHTANYKKGNTLIITNHSNLKRRKGQILPNTQVCLLCVNIYLASLNFFSTPGLSWFLRMRNQRSTCLSDQPNFLHTPFISA